MNNHTSAQTILEQLLFPAFLVKEGAVIQANQDALQRQVRLGDSVHDLISIGTEEYASFSGGRLCLTLQISGITYSASVTTADDCHLFTLDAVYEDPAMRAYALAAQQLREPLSNAMLSTDLLLPNDTIQKDPEALRLVAQVNRSIHQLLRAISNMSDAPICRTQGYRMETCDIVSVFDEILEKSTQLLSQANRTLQSDIPDKILLCLADREKLERAVLNLLSNAAKFSPSGSAIRAQLRFSTNRILFTVENESDFIGTQNLFSRHLRQPGLDNEPSGIGLGMSIVQAVAAAHGGTVLVEHPENAGTRITMTLGIKKATGTTLRSPVYLPTDYAGGRDHALLELADILPDELFEQPF